MNTTKIISSKGHEFTIPHRAVASINSSNCVNCGKCREMCPVNAISEQQRIVCRLCPSCTDRPALPFNDMVSLATEKSCTTACPLGISPQGYVNLTRAGKETEAFGIIWEKNPLPSVCGRVCNHPCEQACKRGLLVDEPIAIRGLKRYLSDTVDYKPAKYPEIHEVKIAIIGAGPAGLTAGHYLAQSGYPVTIFDGEEEPGGMLMRGIPEFRLDRDAVRKDINRLVEAGLDIRLGHRVGKAEFERLKEEYDAVIIAAGAPNSKALRMEGDRKEGIMTALAFMERVNNGQDIWRHPGQEFKMDGAKVVVLGGGNVALDCARTAVRLGAEKVTAVCLESGKDFPGDSWERRDAEEEGVVICEGWAPQKFTGVHCELNGVEFARVKNFCKDENRRISFDVDKEDTQMIPADWVIMAVGSAADNIWLETEAKGNVYKAGDVAGGISNVVESMASGRRTAIKVIESFGTIAPKFPTDDHTLNLADIMEKVYPATRLKIARPMMPIQDVETRKSNFDEVETAYDKDTIDVEVMRCLQCGFEKVDPEKCIGCGVCRSVCPKGDVITLVPVED